MNKKNLRNIDEVAKDTYKWLVKTKIGIWQGAAFIAIIGGLLVWGLFIDYPALQPGVQEAVMVLSPETVTVNENQVFDVELWMNTNDNDVVTIRALVDYDPQHFQFRSYNTTDSVFATGNSCIYQEESCRIVNNDPVEGTFELVLAKPSPGVNTESGLVATLSFESLKPVSPTSKNLLLRFSSQGSYDDSDVILDNGSGTDILKTVRGSLVTVTPRDVLSGKAKVYRFWSNLNKKHFFTSSLSERDLVIENYSDDEWLYEGESYSVYNYQEERSVPVYRFWSDQNHGHFYTINEAERDLVIDTYDDHEWKYEGVGWYAFSNDEGDVEKIPVYRFWSEQNHSHFYTDNENEKESVEANYTDYEWQYEGIAWYAPEND